MRERLNHESPIHSEETSAGIYSKRLNIILLIAISAAFIVSVLFRAPEGNYFTICPFKTFTGLPCPGCGLTHSFCAIGKGDIVRAIGFNLFGPFLFALAIMAWIRSVCVLMGRITPIVVFDAWVRKLRLVRNTVILMAVYGVGRMAWLLIYPPGELQDSPLVRLVAWLKS